MGVGQGRTWWITGAIGAIGAIGCWLTACTNQTGGADGPAGGGDRTSDDEAKVGNGGHEAFAGSSGAERPVFRSGSGAGTVGTAGSHSNEPPTGPTGGREPRGGAGTDAGAAGSTSRGASAAGGTSSGAGAGPTGGAPPNPTLAPTDDAGGAAGSAPHTPAACRVDGDGKTTLVFINGCAESVTYRGSDIPGGVIEPGGSTCVDIGTDIEPLSSKRYWGWTGADPGGEHYTLAEFTFNTDFYDFDWYNISHVDAHNLPLQIVPAERPDCATLTCAESWLESCPAEGRLTDANGAVTACVSPSRDDGESPVALFFEACDDAYAWSGDDQHGDDPSPVRACAGEDWDVVFCPEGAGTQGSRAATSGQAGSGAVSSGADALGAFPFTPSPVTRGGTMTFSNVGALGWWPRRLDREPGDPACDYKDGTDTWGGHCCQQRHESSTEDLAPFDQEMTLILKAIDVKQLAIYQPSDLQPDSSWTRITSWDRRVEAGENLWFTQEGAGSTMFPGDLTRDDCVGYLMQEPTFDCGNGSEYYCPDDAGILHRGFSGSKLVLFLGSMSFEDSRVTECGGSGMGHPGPWVALVASELVRDGGRKWNGLCNCYSKTGTVGDGCGEINVFEVVMDNSEYSNRDFASTGLRSYQAGHVGGAVCMEDCDRDAFLPADVEVVDACAGTAYTTGPEIVVGGATDGCPVWRRPEGDRYFFILLDQDTRTIQVGIIHPAAVPPAATPLIPEIPLAVARSTIDALVQMRLP